MHTAPYFTALGLMAIMNSIRVVQLRIKHRISLGDGGHEDLIRAIRIFGNFTEYVPLGLVLLAALEFVQAPVWYMHICGALLLIGRILHAIGLLGKGSTPPRVIGMVLTYIMLTLSSVGVTLFSLLQLRG
jgi:uncharacterized protein